LWNIFNLWNNLNWLESPTKTPDSNFAVPFIYILIPVLREQSVIEDTINYFQKLNYPKHRMQIVIVTTEKETIEKEHNKYKLSQLAEDIIFQKSDNIIVEKYLGLLPQNILIDSLRLKNLPKERILEQLTNIYANNSTTYEICEKVKNRLNSNYNNLISVVNYPKLNNVVADQINFAINILSEKSKNKNDLVAIYNADSRPHLDTFLSVSNSVIDYQKKYNKIPNIIQQSSLFTLNYNSLPKTISGYILKAGCINQTIWTLANEIFLLRKQSNLINNISNNILDTFRNTEPAYCIAHGMFCNLNYLKLRGGFPTETLNEDLPFGFLTCAKGDSILPIKLLENSESPKTIKSLINQKKVWFSPYLEFFKCRQLAINKNQFRDKTELNILTLKSINVGTIWFFQTFIFLIPLLYLMINFHFDLFIFWFTGIALFWYTPATIVYLKINQLDSKNKVKANLIDFILMVLLGHFNVFFNSIGPFICVFEFAQSKLTGKNILKQKTER
jgi:hypothetical protein